MKEYIEAERPYDHPEWDIKGHLVETQYTIFSDSVPIENYIKDISDILKKSSNLGLMGFTKEGRLAQKYFAEISEDLAALFINIIRNNTTLSDTETLNVINLFKLHSEIQFIDEFPATESYFLDLYDNEIEDLEYKLETTFLKESKAPIKAKRPVLVSDKLVYPRDQEESARAIQAGGFKCAIDTDHVSFISKRTGRQYVEAHHVIPIAMQSEFDLNLDRQGNIISLCPNCHRKIHHADDKDKKELLEIIYKKFKDEISKVIDEEFKLSDLLKYYGITKR